MHRWLALLTLAACDASQPGAASEPVVRWVYAPPPTAWPLGPVVGRFGRGQTPQPVERLGIDLAPGGEALAPLRLATPWAVPGDGPARAILYGGEGDRTAVELVDVDSGRVSWRDRTGCAAPVVGVTAEAIVCADATGMRAIGLDGKPRWKRESPFVAFTDDRVVTAGEGEAIVLDANSGDELARVKLPTGVSADAVVASCGDAGRELFAIDSSGAIGRIAEAKGGPKLAWHTAVGGVAQIDACAGSSILVTTPGSALISLDRATGAITGRVDGARGMWPARDADDRIEVSTASGVTSRSRDLRGDVRVLDLPALGELLDKRGERRLVRVTSATAAVLDRDGVRAYVPLAAPGGVLGDKAIVYASWIGSPSSTVHRVALPAPWHHTLRSLVSGPLPVPAELRDLPPVSDVEAASVSTNQDPRPRNVSAIAIDPADGQALYIEAVARDDVAKPRVDLVRFDLVSSTWRPRDEPCGFGTPIGIAFSNRAVICAARANPLDSTVRAITRDGSPMWSRQQENVDAIAAAGDIVVVFDGDRAVVRDADTGRPLGEVASDDGATVRAVPLAVGGGAVLVTIERGRLVVRVPQVRMLPAWSIEVAGAVRAITAAGDGVLVALEDGDAYRVDLRGTVAALPAIGLAWGAAGDVMTGAAFGGPIPPNPLPMPKLSPPPIGPPPPPPPPTNFEPPPIATPWPPAPPMRASWQTTLFELDGGLRARNDYALAAPVVAGPRGEAASPLVVSYGSDQNEALVIDARTGDPLRRVRMPDDASGAQVFGAVVAGRPVAGAVLAAPLRVVLF